MWKSATMGIANPYVASLRAEGGSLVFADGLSIYGTDAHLNIWDRSSLNASDLWLGYDRYYGIRYAYVSLNDTSTNPANLIIRPDFVSMNASDGQVEDLALPANVTTRVKGCRSLKYYYDRSDLPQSPDEIMANGREFMPAYTMCSSTRATYEVPGFTGYTASGQSEEEHKAEEPECTKDSDCPGECYYCSPANEICMLVGGARCGVDSDCGEGYECSGCVCVQTGCVSDEECGPGYTCADGECVPPECTKDSDCKEGYECKNYECVKEEVKGPEEEKPKEGEEPGVQPGEQPEEEEPEVPEVISPIKQTEVPSVEAPQQPLTEEQANFQSTYGWWILGLAIILILLYFKFVHKRS
jgi:hypothetical protein